MSVYNTYTTCHTAKGYNYRMSSVSCDKVQWCVIGDNDRMGPIVCQFTRATSMSQHKGQYCVIAEGRLACYSTRAISMSQHKGQYCVIAEAPLACHITRVIRMSQHKHHYCVIAEAPLACHITRAISMS